MQTRFTLSLIFSLILSLASFAASGTDPLYTEQKTSIAVKPSQPQFIIQLKSNPSTGYSWFLREYNSRYVEPLKHRYQAADNRRLVGAPGYEVWTFKMKPEAFTLPRQLSLHFIYARPWEKQGEATDLVFRISTLGN